MNSLKLNRLVSQALSITNNSCMHFKHAALIVRNGKVVASGFNNQKEHAEMNAIKNLRRQRKGSRVIL